MDRLNSLWEYRASDIRDGFGGKPDTSALLRRIFSFCAGKIDIPIACADNSDAV